MNRLLPMAVVLVGLVQILALGPAGWASAQEQAPAESPSGAEELEALARTLENPEARARLIVELRALIAAERGIEAEEAPPASGNAVLWGLSERLGSLGRGAAGLVVGVGDLVRIGPWLGDQVTDPERRRLWVETLIKLALALGFGLGVGWTVRLGLRRRRSALEQRERPRLLLRAPLLAARTGLDLVPIAAFAAAAYAALAIAQPDERTRLVMLAAINAIAIARAGVAIARLMFTPLSPSLRLIALSDRTAAYAFVWSRRLINIPVYGYFAGQAALALGLPEGGYGVFVKLLGLVLTAMLLALVLQNRDAVAAAIRGRGAEGAGTRPAFRALRNPLADVWHVLALLYLATVYGIWALDIEEGFLFVVRGTVVTVVVFGAAAVLVILVRQGLARAFRVGDEIRARFPLIEQRANRYLPAVRGTLSVLIYVIATLTVLQAWGLDTLAWLVSGSGRALVGSAFNIVVVLAVAVIVWEVANAAITRFLEGTDQEGKVVERGARARTLLPLARNALLAALVVVSTLTILSSLGVEIGPLLAGAGVVGLAIGFGAQTLVKDIITGAFILFEDSIAVGDYIEVGGRSGTVETLTVRTIRLRDPAGTVHTMPFSSVDVVTNKTKDYAYYIAEVGVGYREDVDEVAAVLREVGEDLCQDPKFGPDVLEPIAIDGLDRFDDSAVVIRARLKTLPGKQWRIKREFNRRVKYAFDARGIEIPFPHQTIYFGEDKKGEAPPARFKLEAARASKGEPREGPRARESDDEAAS